MTLSISTLPTDIAAAGHSGSPRPIQPLPYPPVVSTLPSFPPVVSTLPFPPSASGTLPLHPPVVSTLPFPPPVTGTLPLYPPSRNDVVSTVEELNKFVSQSVPSITFSQDDDSGKTIIKVIDTTDNTVLRQIPSQEALQIAKSLDKLQGWLINQKA